MFSQVFNQFSKGTVGSLKIPPYYNKKALPTITNKHFLLSVLFRNRRFRGGGRRGAEPPTHLPFRRQRLQRRHPLCIHYAQCKIHFIRIKMQRRNGRNFLAVLIIHDIFRLLQFCLIQAIHKKHFQILDFFHRKTLFSSISFSKTMQFLDLDRFIDLVPSLRFIVLLLFLQNSINRRIIQRILARIRILSRNIRRTRNIRNLV